MPKTQSPGNRRAYPPPRPKPWLHARKDNRICTMLIRTMTFHDIPTGSRALKCVLRPVAARARRRNQAREPRRRVTRTGGRARYARQRVPLPAGRR